MDFDSTITIPAQDDPNYLHQALHELVKNSYFKHKIIIIWDRRAPHLDAGARDFSVNPRTGDTRWQPYKSIPEMFEAHVKWFEENHITHVDVTQRYHEWPQRTSRESFEGNNIAFKNNVGLELTTTEWTIPNWDTDFHPSWHWDKSIFEYARVLPGDRREVLIPMHVQPQLMDDDPAEFDGWGPRSRSYARNRMAIPTRRMVPGAAYLTEAEFFAFCSHNAKPGQIITERPGDREQLHWVPWILRTHAIQKQIGGFPYTGAGYDILFDDMLRDKWGGMKKGFCDSFCGHKMWCPLDAGVCPDADRRLAELPR